MPRYVSAPKIMHTSDYGWYDQPQPPLPHPTVFPVEPIRTGLLDPDGNDIYRAPDSVGFLAK